MPNAPLVTVLVAVHNGGPYTGSAVVSVLRQTVSDFELIVVDDASTDCTPTALASFGDSRLRVLRNEVQRGLAGSLNRGLDEARGRYIARLDADDVAFQNWLERTLPLLRSRRGVGLVGAGVIDIDAAGHPGPVHIHESGSALFRWRALFSSPVFHDTVVIDREVLERHRLRYDETFGESEDYDLWTRILRESEGDTVEDPLVLHRLHPDQASRRRADLQRTLAHDISLHQIEELTPGLPRRRAELARMVGIGGKVRAEDASAAAESYLGLLDRFTTTWSYPEHERKVVREVAARSLARLAIDVGGSMRVRLLREAAALDRSLPARVVARRARRQRQTRSTQRHAVRLLRSLESSGGEARISVVAVFPEPTPYRAPLLDRVAALDEVDLTVVYAAPTVARRTWTVEPRHDALFLRGVRLPGAERILHHDYPVTPGIVPALQRADPDVVVVSGWSTFAAQAAITWCRLRKVPYVLVVESHDAGPRPGWRKTVKGTVVPRVVQGASGALVTGTLARRSMIERGAPLERVHVFANTVDVAAFEERADRLAARRPELRAELGAGEDDVVVLSVARLAREKRHDVLVRAVSDAADARLLLVLVGEGPERERLDALARELGVRLVLTGDRPWERIVEAYAAADVFALLSEREPWAVVVNEAAACGLPLVLSDRVGAAHDLLEDGGNGVLVAAGDVDAAAEALHRLAKDPKVRRAMGARSRDIAHEWGYEPSVEGFLEAVREAVRQSPR